MQCTFLLHGDERTARVKIKNKKKPWEVRKMEEFL